MDRLEASTAAGALAPFVGLGSVLLATLVSPSFAWRSNALSDLGVPGEPTAWLFNGGLVLTALLVVAFLPALWRAARNGLQRVGTAAFGLSGVSIGLVGVFHLPSPRHRPVAIGFFLFLSVALWIHGAGDLRTGARRYGLGGLVLGTANIAAWVAWATIGDVFRPGLAVPEIAGAVVLAVWTGWTVRRLGVAA
jgi:hypothetical membrane protein